MSQKRKISIRKIIQTLLSLCLIVACCMAFTSASKLQTKHKLKGVNIQISNEDYCQFINKNEIENRIFKNRNINSKQLNFDQLQLQQVENILESEAWIEKAQVYVDNKKILHINVSQKQPQLRVFDVSGNSYYLDSNANALPLSEQYTQYELLFTNVPVLKNDSSDSLFKIKMIKLARYIKQDSFWLAQCAQIVVNAQREFEIIPVLGTHRILIGNAENIDEQLENVFVFYKNILNKVGWNTYESLDARFKNQIIAMPSLQLKIPQDRALSNINWVKAIMGNIPFDEAASQNATQNLKTNLR